MAEQPSQTKHHHSNRLLWLFVGVIFLCWLSVCCLAGEGLLLWKVVSHPGHPGLPTTTWQETPEREVIPLRTPTPAGRPTVSATPADKSATPPAALTFPLTTVQPGDAGYATMHAWDDAVVPTRDLRDLGIRYHPEWRAQLLAFATPAAPSHRVGDVAKFWVFNDSQEKHVQIRATLRYVTPHVYFWVEKGLEVDQNALQKAAEEFETKIYPTDHRYFGYEESPGIDGDVHLYFLISDKLGNGLLGYFSGSDCFPRPVNPYSNEKDMFFLNAQHLRLDSDLFLSTAAHEFQHMIQWNQDRNETTWLNEGLSMLAERLNGFLPSFHVESFIAEPDTPLTAWPDKKASANYGAAELFTTYLYGRFGGHFIRQLADAPANGLLSVTDLLKKMYGGVMNADDLFAHWTVANVLNDDTLAGGWYGYHDSLVPTVDASTFTEVDRLPARRSGSVHQYATDYFSVPSFEKMTITFKGATSNRIAPLSAHEGRYVYWFNADNDSDVYMTRTLDLRSVAQAHLRFWTWYNLENLWDFLYVSVSPDGGQNWYMLHNGDTTKENPYGNNLGVGFTGHSGNGDHVTWNLERFDLSRWAGKQIQLRFEYVTDDAIVHAGFFLDDIAVPEIGFADGFERPSGRWHVAGAVRTDLIVPQRYAVQVIRWDRRGVQVIPLPLQADQTGALTVAAEGKGKAIIVVSGLAPITRETAPYTLTLH